MKVLLAGLCLLALAVGATDPKPVPVVKAQGFATAPVILAGGLTPENVREAIITVKPYAVDVNSGVECRNGRKSPDRVRAFVRQAHDTFEEMADSRPMDKFRIMK